jgi:D-alanyl-D-alanine carboxypeptidase
MPVKLLLIAFAGLLTAASPSPAGFQVTISKVSRGELSYSYRPGCPVAPAALRRLLRLVEAYKGSDDASMAADNTSGFNCRRVFAGGPWSAHAYGLAIDLNPVENPYVHRGVVEPPAGRRYLDRAKRRRGMVVAGGAVVRAFAAIGWPWGGHWTSSKDYQHFSATGR